MIITPFAYMATQAADAWSPEDFTNVQYWWRADLGVTESGGNVTVWEDQINSYQLSGVIGTPTKTTEAGLNGADVIDFDSDALYSTSTPASRTGDFTLLGVYYADTLSANESIFGVSRLSAAGDTQFQHTHYTSTYGLSLFSRKFGASGADLITLDAPPAATGAHAFKGRYDASAGDVFASLDTLTETAGGTAGNTSQDWDTSVTFAAGAWVDSTSGGVSNSRYFNGKIAEMVLIYDSPDSTEMNNWKTYVNNRYGTIIS